MATATPSGLNTLIKDSKLLVVGAGGIGCELLKNVVLSGFKDIVVVYIAIKIMKFTFLIMYCFRLIWTLLM